MKLHHHTAISLTISAILFLLFRSWALAAANLIAGIFIDLDHFFDYTYGYGRPFRVRDFFRACHTCQFNRIFLFLHGWEWVIILGTAAWLTEWNPWVTGTFVGIGQHIFLDTIHNRSGFKSYFLLWRWKKDFDFDTIFHSLTRYKYKYRNDLYADPDTD